MQFIPNGRQGKKTKKLFIILLSLLRENKEKPLYLCNLFEIVSHLIF
jgi:hypothetical protein